MNVSEQEKAEAFKRLEEYIDKIHYSERYCDDEYEYRHVILPKPLFKLIPKQYFTQDNSDTLRLLSEREWHGIGITQSLGWEHYEVYLPEPCVLLFRRVLERADERRERVSLQLREVKVRASVQRARSMQDASHDHEYICK